MNWAAILADAPAHPLAASNRHDMDPVLDEKLHEDRYSWGCEIVITASSTSSMHALGLPEEVSAGVLQACTACLDARVVTTNECFWIVQQEPLVLRPKKRLICWGVDCGRSVFCSATIRYTI